MLFIIELPEIIGSFFLRDYLIYLRIPEWHKLIIFDGSLNIFVLNKYLENNISGI